MIYKIIGGFLILLSLLQTGMLLWTSVVPLMRYRPGRNRYHRICRKCGQHQIVYESCFGMWWDEVYPVGNDPECRCHRDTQHRDF